MKTTTKTKEQLLSIKEAAKGRFVSLLRPKDANNPESAIFDSDYASIYNGRIKNVTDTSLVFQPSKKNVGLSVFPLAGLTGSVVKVGGNVEILGW